MDNELISLFQENIARESAAFNLGTLDVVVGIPVVREDTAIRKVIDTARTGLMLRTSVLVSCYPLRPVF